MSTQVVQSGNKIPIDCLLSNFMQYTRGVQTFFLATQMSASKSYVTQTEKNMNLPNLERGVSLLSFTEFIEVLGYFGHSTQHFGHSTPQVRTFMAFLFLKC